MVEIHPSIGPEYSNRNGLDPFFSVIVPTYNRAKSAKKAILSVLSQSFENFEILVVDDGSTDDTESIVTSIPDSRIRYLKKENEERSIARNFGIKNAAGKYINFLDSDDYQYPYHLETAHQLLYKNNYPEICHLGFEMVDNAGQVLKSYSNFDDLQGRIFDENILCGNAIFIRKEIASKYSFPHNKNAVISEDWCLFLRLSIRYQVHFDKTITSAFVEHQERSLRNINPDKLISSTEIIISVLRDDETLNTAFKNKMNYFFSNQYTLVTLILSLTKNRRLDTLRYLVKSVKYDFSVIFRRRFLASIKHLF